ncbi:hypothetical protein So717_06460 [Roseobacter cerasinus]|uniref:Uncharacterized protein n=1 Tax=Roseobacter cerasinus TaxID=2602289 RepID=A0A640VKR3_9RHOB|nr:hypothetical protein So717_06460 [Roseobacter cerasinus]
MLPELPGLRMGCLRDMWFCIALLSGASKSFVHDEVPNPGAIRLRRLGYFPESPWDWFAI